MRRHEPCWRTTHVPPAGVMLLLAQSTHVTGMVVVDRYVDAYARPSTVVHRVRSSVPQPMWADLPGAAARVVLAPCAATDVRDRVTYCGVCPVSGAMLLLEISEPTRATTALQPS